VDDETGLVGKIKAKGELDERIKKVWKKGVFANSVRHVFCSSSCILCRWTAI
jgi:hypothetical protein